MGKPVNLRQRHGSPDADNSLRKRELLQSTSLQEDNENATISRIRLARNKLSNSLTTPLFEEASVLESKSLGKTRLF
jgi:hypothetical protein